MKQGVGFKVIIFLAFLFVVNLIFYVTFFKEYLNNDIVNSYSPAGDAFDYVRKAETLINEGSFTKAFADGYRMPGYSLFLSLSYSFFKSPLLASRYIQLIFVSLLPIIFYFTLFSLFRFITPAVLGSLLASLYVPFYYFSPVLCPETLCIFLFAILHFLLSRHNIQHSLSLIILMDIVIVLSVYLRPNLIILCFPLLIFIWYPIRTYRENKSISYTLVSLAFIVSMILPWSIFISEHNHRFVLLGTNQGINLYLGTVTRSGGPYIPEKANLPEKVAASFHLDDQSNDPDRHQTDQGKENWQRYSKMDGLYKRIAIDTWISRPIAMSAFGFSKVLHSFGFSFRDFRDITLALHFIASISLSIYLWKVNQYRKWCVFFWSILFITVLHAFIFSYERRYKTVIFDFPALLIISAGLAVFLQNSRLMIYMAHIADDR